MMPISKFLERRIVCRNRTQGSVHCFCVVGLPQVQQTKICSLDNKSIIASSACRIHCNSSGDVTEGKSSSLGANSHCSQGSKMHSNSASAQTATSANLAASSSMKKGTTDFIGRTSTSGNLGKDSNWRNVTG